MTKSDGHDGSNDRRQVIAVLFRTLLGEAHLLPRPLGEAELEECPLGLHVCSLCCTATAHRMKMLNVGYIYLAKGTFADQATAVQQKLEGKALSC